MDKNMTLEKRIAAELYCYQGKMSVFVDDLHGHTVEVGADEEFETASTIKAYILAALYLQASRGKASLEEKITYKPEHFVDGSGMLRALGVGASLKVKDAATMMIICSDNIATNMVIDYLGLDTINACIREMGFAHTVLHNPLHFDLYSDLGTTTPRDYASLFGQVAKGTDGTLDLKKALLALGIGFGIGLYDGMVGPGTGTFAIIAFTSLMGFDLRTANGNAKVLNLASNYASLFTYLVNSLVVFHIGIPCAISNILGNLLGSHFALKKGARFIRPMMLVVLVLLLGKLISDAVL